MISRDAALPPIGVGMYAMWGSGILTIQRWYRWYPSNTTDEIEARAGAKRRVTASAFEIAAAHGWLSELPCVHSGIASAE